MRTLLIATGVVVGLLVGSELPDLDQHTRGVLLHRSIVTHGWLIPLVIWLAARARPREFWLRFGAIGLSVAVAVHLCFDLFPAAWSGFARISIPGYGWSSAPFSWIWIAASVVVCLALALLAAASQREVWLVAGLALLGFALGAQAPRAAVLGPLLALLGGGALALWATAGVHAPVRDARRRAAGWRRR